jgi:hypothetical protein
MEGMGHSGGPEPFPLSQAMRDYIVWYERYLRACTRTDIANAKAGMGQALERMWAEVRS